MTKKDYQEYFDLHYGDSLEHGWLKDKAHKYIDKYIGPSGKWVYRYHYIKNRATTIGKKIKNKAVKAYVESSLNKYRNKRKREKLAKLKAKQQADWNSSKLWGGRYKAYRTRKKDIKQARANAKGTHTSQYYTSSERRKQISDARNKVLNKRKQTLRRTNSKRSS